MSKITVRCVDDVNKKIEAVLYTEEQWGKLKDHVTKAARRAQEVADELRLKEERKLCSNEMAKKWDNTYVNLRKKRLEDRRLRLQREKDRKYERFFKIQKDKEELKEKVRIEASERLYEETDNAKEAISAYKFAETLRERKLQMEFADKCKAIEAERERDYVKSVYDDVDAFYKEEAEKKAKYLERKMQLSKESTEMFHNAEERKRRDKEEADRIGREDMQLMRKEIQQVEQNEEEEKRRRIQMVRRELIQAREAVEEQRKIRKAEENEENEAFKIIANAKMRMGKIRKEKEAMMKAAAIERRLRIGSTVAAIHQAKETEEEEKYQNARAEKEALELKRLERERDHKMRLRQERIAYRAECVRQEELNKWQQHELAKWGMLQQFKSKELDQKFQELVQARNRRKILDFRYDNMLQIEENDQKRREEKAADKQAVERAAELWNQYDQKFFKFVDALKEECERVGRPVFPLDNVLCAYKKRTGLLELPTERKELKSSIPIAVINEKCEVKKSDPVRIEYTKMGNAKNPNRREPMRRVPLTYVKNIGHANGLQDTSVAQKLNKKN